MYRITDNTLQNIRETAGKGLKTVSDKLNQMGPIAKVQR